MTSAGLGEAALARRPASARRPAARPSRRRPRIAAAVASTSSPSSRPSISVTPVRHGAQDQRAVGDRLVARRAHAAAAAGRPRRAVSVAAVMSNPRLREGCLAVRRGWLLTAASTRGKGAAAFRAHPSRGSPPLANPELGAKQVCPNCQAKFYDLSRRPAHCPKCADRVRSRRGAEAAATAARRPRRLPDRRRGRGSGQGQGGRRRRGRGRRSRRDARDRRGGRRADPDRRRRRGRGRSRRRRPPSADLGVAAEDDESSTTTTTTTCPSSRTRTTTTSTRRDRRPAQDDEDDRSAAADVSAVAGAKKVCERA